jgi:hypothetical protein
MKTRRWSLLAVPVVLAACSAKPADDSTSEFRTVADVKQIMDAIIDPASDLYFAASGVVVDAQGEHQLAPKDDEEWQAVVNAAYTVAEAGNLLLIGDRKKDDDAWVTMAQQLIDSGQRAAKAAEARDLQAVFDMGAEVYAVCTNCHTVYYIPFYVDSTDAPPTDG